MLCAQRALRARGARDRLGRIAALFTFVGQLTRALDLPADAAGARAATGPETAGALRAGVEALVHVAGPDAGRAVLLAALLKAAGERAQIDYARELVFVRVEIDLADAARLPPHAALIVAGRRGRVYLPLWVRHACSPLGFLPRPTREGLARRRFIL